MVFTQATAPGCAVKVTVGRAFTVVANVVAVPFPQPFEGVTVTFPEVAPTVAVTEFVVVPAVCVQPEGNDQV